MHSGLRYTITAPLAALLTAGLFIGMKALITGEFKPKPKIAAAQFEINPVADDIIAEPRVTKLAALETVETPPPPPIIERVKAAQPQEPIATPIIAPHPFDPLVLDIKTTQFAISDAEAKPLFRVAANMPPRAQRSGHCNVIFDVSPQGEPYNIKAPFCTEPMFERPTLKAVAKWKYRPKIQDGQAVARTGVRNKMSFNLTNEQGQIIPE